MSFDPTCKENIVNGVRIKVESVQSSFISWRNITRIMAVISFSFVDKERWQGDLRFGWYFPVFGREVVSPLIVFPNSDFDQIDPKEVSSKIANQFDLTFLDGAVIRKAAGQMAASAIHDFAYTRMARAIFGDSFYRELELERVLMRDEEESQNDRP